MRMLNIYFFWWLQEQKFTFLTIFFKLSSLQIS